MFEQEKKKILGRVVKAVLRASVATKERRRMFQSVILYDAPPVRFFSTGKKWIHE